MIRNGTDRVWAHHAAAAALGTMIVATACTRVPVKPASVPEHVFKIAFDDKGCPASAQPVDATPCPPNSPPSCVTAHRNDVITFQADAGSPPFSVTFDPFSPPLSTPPGQTSVWRQIHPQARYTTYKFSVSVDADTCPIIDPYIIVNR